MYGNVRKCTVFEAEEKGFLTRFFLKNIKNWKKGKKKSKKTNFGSLKLINNKTKNGSLRK